MAILAGHCPLLGSTFIDWWYEWCPLELCKIVALPEKPRKLQRKGKKRSTADYKKIIYSILYHKPVCNWEVVWFMGEKM